MKKLIDFLFFRWKREIIQEGSETWIKRPYGYNLGYETERYFVKYKLTNKFDGSEKIEKVYLN